MWEYAQSHEHSEHRDLDVDLMVLALVLLGGLVVVFGLAVGGRL
jgi:hypothetical protein